MAESNDCLSDDMLDSLLFMACGIDRNIDGGWLLSRFTYCGVFPGFMLSLYDADRRSSVMSR